MSLITIQRSPTPSDHTDSSSISQNDESIATNSQSEDFFISKDFAILQNQIGRRSSTTIKEGDTMQFCLRKAVSLIRKQDSLRLIVHLEKVNSAIEGYRYFCVLSTNGRQNTEEFFILGLDILSNSATIGLVIPIRQDMSVSLDGDGGFKIKNIDGEKLFKPTSVQALWSTVQLLNKACSVAHQHNYYSGGLSHTWIGFYSSNILSNRAQIAEWNRMIDADTIINSNMAPKSAIGEFVIGTIVNECVQNKDEIRMHLKEIMRDEDMDNVTVTHLREKLQERVSFCLKEYRSFIQEEILIIYGQMDRASKILPHLYLGSTYNASNLDELETNNITHILNVTRESENFFREKFIYRNVEVFDVDETNLLNYFNDCYQFISEAKYRGSACLVHCQRGISRSASVVIAYMMKEFSWSCDKAIEEVKSKRDCIRPNDSFLMQLKTYEGILKAKQDFIALIKKISTQRDNKDIKRRKRSQIMSFPIDLTYETNMKDVLTQSPTDSCTPPCRCKSAIHADRIASFSSDNTSTDTVMTDSLPSGIDHPLDTASNVSNKIDIHGELLQYKPTKDCSDIESNIGTYRSQIHDYAKRSLRLKGDDSWIKTSSNTVRSKDFIEALNVTDPELLFQHSRMCQSGQFDPQFDIASDGTEVDHQSLRPVKELMTKYSNVNLID